MEYHDHAAPFREAAPQAEGTSVGEYYIGQVRIFIRRLGNELHECTACGITLSGAEMRNHVLSHGAAPAETARPVSLEEVELLLAEDVKYCRKHNKGDGYLVMTALKRVDGYARAFAKQRVEQAERLVQARWVDIANKKSHQITELAAKVADLERELAAGQGRPRYCKKCGGNQAYHRKDGCISHGTTGVDDNGKPTCKCTIKDFEPGELVSPPQPNHLTAAVNRRMADLERERDEAKYSLLDEINKLKASESELREMREALADFVQQLKRALQRNKEAELVELIANGNRLLARKAGS